MKSKITVRWQEELIDHKDRGEFYWRFRPVITQRNYIEKGDYERVVEQYRKHFGAHLSPSAVKKQLI